METNQDKINLIASRLPINESEHAVLVAALDILTNGFKSDQETIQTERDIAETLRQQLRDAGLEPTA